LLVLRGIVGDVRSNIPLRSDLRLADAWKSVGHTLIDLGEDEFTQARAHPMIDPTLRNHRLADEAEDPEVAVILLDVVLGHGCHADPAGSVAEAVREAKALAAAAGRHLVVVAAVCGTNGDPQSLSGQEQALRDAGVLVLPTNAGAARLAGLIARYAGER
jgi:FdrA protein